MPQEAEGEPKPGSRKLPGPSLHGRDLYLRPIVPEDYRSLHAIELSDRLGPRWRFRGTTPSPEQWSQVTWASTLAQFLVIRRKDERPIGMVAVHQADFQDGYAYMSAARFEPSRPAPLMMVGIAIFLNYVFTCWSFRKLYLEVPEYNYEQFESVVERYCKLEGRLRDHYFFAGRYWDQMVLAIYREHWEVAGEQVLRAAGLNG